MADVKSFQDLDAWKACREVRQAVFKLAKTFPAEEKYRLIDQLVRASRSPAANLAEGCGRFHYRENAQFCRQARGSLYETIDHLSVALECGYIDQSAFDQADEMIQRAIKVVNGFIRYLSGRSSKTKARKKGKPVICRMESDWPVEHIYSCEVRAG